MPGHQMLQAMGRRAANALPLRLQTALKKRYFSAKIRMGSFGTAEPECALLDRWINQGDWVIDGGANVGHYTLPMSRLVGPAGRVLAFEPMPVTFEILTCNCSAAGCDNVSLLNVALSSESRLVSMELPSFDNGVSNYYEARIGSSGSSVLALAADDLNLPATVSLIKLDLEGHEAAAIRGMLALLRRDKPRLIVEGRDDEVARMLSELGYRSETYHLSPNQVWTIS
jgi:FkbM family methyltransferase